MPGFAEARPFTSYGLTRQFDPLRAAPSCNIVAVPPGSFAVFTARVVDARAGSPSRGLHAPCVRFAVEVALAPRNTRSRLVATYYRGRTRTCGSSSKVSICNPLSHTILLLQAFPGALSQNFVRNTPGIPLCNTCRIATFVTT